MHLLTPFASLPDTTLLVLVGSTLIAIALVLKKRLVSMHANPVGTDGLTVESRDLPVHRTPTGNPTSSSSHAVSAATPEIDCLTVGR